MKNKDGLFKQKKIAECYKLKTFFCAITQNMRYYLITHRSVSVKSHSNKNVKLTMNTFSMAQIYIIPALVYIYVFCKHRPNENI